MSITRRQFLSSIPAGIAVYILPCFFTQGSSATPLIGKTPNILYALNHGDEQFELHHGDPYAVPPDKTWREYIEDEFGDLQSFMEWNGYYPGDFTEDMGSLCDYELYYDTWARSESSNARAFHLLSALELGDELEELIIFIDGCCPGNDYLGVNAKNLHALNLLQVRLNQLNEGIKIQIYTESA